MEDLFKPSTPSRTFQVDLTATATATVRVKISGENLNLIARELGKAVGDLTVNDIRDYAEEVALEDMPEICAQCSGWGSEHFSMDLGEWEVAEDLPTHDSAVVEVTL